jgi:hypothetical protein
MTTRLTTAQRLLGAAVLTIASVVVAGAGTYWILRVLDATGAESARAATALRLQMQADMAHDALRSDVLNALVSGASKDAAQEKAVRDDLAQHSALFRDSMKALREIDVDPEIAVAVDRLGPSLGAYLAEASATATQAFADPAKAQERLAGGFATSFKAVEKEMSALSELIESHAKGAQAEGEATSARARTMIVVGTLVGALLIGGLGVALGVEAGHHAD